MTITSDKYNKLILLAIFITGIFLRMITITWGLPDDMRQYSYNMDEGTNLEMVKNFEPNMLNFDTKNYISGHFGYYIFAGSILAGNVLGFYELVPKAHYYREHINELRNIYVAQRLLIVLVSSLVIIVSFSIGKEVGNYNLGLLMAGYAAFMPSILVNSQYCTVDMILVALLAVSFLFFLKYIHYGKKKDLYLLSLFCGLSLSTKHSGVFGLVFLIYAIYHCKMNNKTDNWKKQLALSMLIVFLSFSFTSPYLIKYKLLQLISPEIQKQSGALAGFHWNLNVRGLPLYFWKILKIYYFETGMISIFFLVAFLKKKFIKYAIPLLLFILIFQFAVLITKYGTDSRLLPNGYFIGIVSVLGFYGFLTDHTIRLSIRKIAAIVIIVWAVSYAGIVKYRFIDKDTREASSEWIIENILNLQNDVSIGLNAPPWTGFPDIIAKEWMHSKHPHSQFYPDKYNETLIIPAHGLETSEGNILLPERPLDKKADQMQWLISHSPEYIIVSWSSDPKYSHDDWPAFLNKHPRYQMVKHFPAYNILGISHLNIFSFDVYIYKHV